MCVYLLYEVSRIRRDVVVGRYLIKRYCTVHMNLYDSPRTDVLFTLKVGSFQIGTLLGVLAHLHSSPLVCSLVRECWQGLELFPSASQLNGKNATINTE